MKRRLDLVLLVVAALVAALASGPARADDIGSVNTSPAFECTVERKCSSAGMTCNSDDTACQSKATSQGLEVICVNQRPAARRFVYCPPGSGRDSNVVWLLLGVASVLAVGGSAVAYLVLRTKKA